MRSSPFKYARRSTRNEGKVMTHKLERPMFENLWAAENFNARELQAQTGQSSSNCAAEALKELLNNALDAARWQA